MSYVFSQTETCDCKTDLDFVVKKIQKMPSYKKQIKGDNKETQFENLYATLLEKMEQPVLVEDCFKMLIEQMSLVNDSHAALSTNNIVLSKEDIEDAAKLAAFKTTDRFKNHPKTNRNLLELTEELSNTSPEDLEGIYNHRDEQRIGIYYADNQKDLVGVILESSLNQWEAGEIRFYATHTFGNKYDVYYYHTTTRTPGLVKSLVFENGRIWSYKKEGNTNNNEFRDKSLPELDFKQINENTQYLYFGNFSNGKKDAHTKFYNDVKDKISAENIIVDLRSNTGGNKKFSDPFLKLLKNKNVYIITNCFTGSNGEQFTVKLKNLKNAKHLGQSTFGVIAYGLNYGRSYDTPSGHFSILPTDMNFHEYFEYEGKGVSPEFPLDFDKDWMAQTLEIIDNDATK